MKNVALHMKDYSFTIHISFFFIFLSSFLLYNSGASFFPKSIRSFTPTEICQKFPETEIKLKKKYFSSPQNLFFQTISLSLFSSLLSLPPLCISLFFFFNILWWSITSTFILLSMVDAEKKRKG